MILVQNIILNYVLNVFVYNIHGLKRIHITLEIVLDKLTK